MILRVLDKPATEALIRPPVLDTVEDGELAYTGNGIPDNVVLIALGGGRYAANGARTIDKFDPTNEKDVKVIVCFKNEEQAKIWENIWNLSGTYEPMALDKAREICVSKPYIHGLSYVVDGRSLEILWVR